MNGIDAHWTWGFVLGSYVATFAQGIALGTFIQGIAVEGRAYAGGWFDWLTPFSVFTGAALVAGYALLGACFLIMKTGGALQDRMFRFALPLGAAVLASIAVVSVWTPFLDPVIARALVLLAEHRPPLAGAAPGRGDRARLLPGARGAGGEAMPFIMAILLFLVSYAGLAISVYPYIVPRAMTVWDAAAPGREPRFPAGRNGGAGADHPRL